MDKASRETVPECNIQSQTLLPRVRVLEQKKKKSRIVKILKFLRKAANLVSFRLER